MLADLIQEIPDAVLENEDTIKIYGERLRTSRNGLRPKEQQNGQGLTLEEVGQNLGISTVMVAAKEGANKKKSLCRIDKDDLLAFCCIYQVSPHYLLGLMDSPAQYKISMGTQQRKGNHNETFDDFSEKSIQEFPFLIPSTAVQSRGQLIIYNLKDNQALLTLLIQLANSSRNVQQKVLSRFMSSKSIANCQIEEHLVRISTKEFKDAWLEFVVFSPDQDRRIEHMKILENLGKRNFDVLDFIAKIAVCPSETQKMVQSMLEDDKYLSPKKSLPK